MSEHTVMDIKERQMERVTPGPTSSTSGCVVREKIAWCLALVLALTGVAALIITRRHLQPVGWGEEAEVKKDEEASRGLFGD